jgi:multiple sugar transport system ATP-binding protein
MAKVVLKDVSKLFGDVTAVNKVNLEIEDREFVVLVGPSGCGKTTTLRMVAGLEDITEGEVYIKDRMVNFLSPKQRNIAMVFQSYALYPHMKVFDNIAFGLKMRKVPKAEREKQVKRVANILGLEYCLYRKPKELSGGERQRVALGRAIVRDPDLFLFDEPLSNLDAKLRAQMRIELKKLHRRLESTVVYVTHDQVEAMTMGDRIVVMKGGIVQQVGTPLELYNRPSNQFVAGFIGSPAMNFIPCRLLEEKSRLYIDTNDYKIALPEALASKVGDQRGNEFVFGIRPEHFLEKASHNGRLHDSPTIKAMVNVTETLGKETLFDLTTGMHSLIALLNGDTNTETDRDIELVLNMEKIHLFREDNGETLF